MVRRRAKCLPLYPLLTSPLALPPAATIRSATMSTMDAGEDNPVESAPASPDAATTTAEPVPSSSSHSDSGGSSSNLVAIVGRFLSWGWEGGESRGGRCPSISTSLPPCRNLPIPVLFHTPTAAGAVGGAVAALLIGLLAWCCMRRRRSARTDGPSIPSMAVHPHSGV